jgi:hypothetical protein
MWNHGVEKLWLRPVTNHDDPNFLSIEVAVPDTWGYLLTNEEGDRRKRQTSRSHVTLAEDWVLQQMEPEHREDFKQAVLEFYNEHFPRLDKTEWQRFTDDKDDWKKLQ